MLFRSSFLPTSFTSTNDSMIVGSSVYLALLTTLAAGKPQRLPSLGGVAPPHLPPSATGNPAASAPAPTMVLDYGSFIGFNEDGVTNYLGVPFVEPPVGDLRYRLPIMPPAKFAQIQNATLYGPSCHQLGANQNENAVFAALPPEVVQKFGQQTAGQVLTTGESEDVSQVPLSLLKSYAHLLHQCLTINVKIPDGPVPEGGFPIVAWIFGVRRSRETTVEA